MKLSNIKYRFKLLDALSAAKELVDRTLVLYFLKGKYVLLYKEDFFPCNEMRDITQIEFSNDKFLITFRERDGSKEKLSDLIIGEKKDFTVGRLRDGTYVH